MKTLRGRCKGIVKILSRSIPLAIYHRTCWLSQCTRLFLAYPKSILFLAYPKSIRFLPLWVTSLKRDEYTLKHKVPWITFEAKEWLCSFLTPNMSVFEYGSGGSTIFISRRVKKLVAVEHDRKWYQHVSKVIKESNISNCQYLLLEPQPYSYGQSDFRDPRNYVSSSSNYKNASFETYVRSIESFPDESFDLVLVVGKARPSCIVHARSKVRVGGFLMLDNSERESYQMGKDLIVHWERTDFFGAGPVNEYFWQTTVWLKNRAESSFS